MGNHRLLGNSEERMYAGTTLFTQVMDFPP